MNPEYLRLRLLENIQQIETSLVYHLMNEEQKKIMAAQKVVLTNNQPEIILPYLEAVVRNYNA